MMYLFFFYRETRIWEQILKANNDSHRTDGAERGSIYSHRFTYSILDIWTRKNVCCTHPSSLENKISSYTRAFWVHKRVWKMKSISQDTKQKGYSLGKTKKRQKIIDCYLQSSFSFSILLLLLFFCHIFLAIRIRIVIKAIFFWQ